MVKKVIIWALIIFAVWYLLTNPDGAANFGQHLLNGVRSAGRSLASFLSHL